MEAMKIGVVAYSDVPGYPGEEFQVGKDGSAWNSLDGGKSWKRLKPQITRRDGRDHVSVRPRIGGKQRTVMLARAILMAFDRRPSYGNLHACKEGGRPDDFSLRNLKWMPKGYSQMGKRPKNLALGSRRGSAKLIEEDIPVICDMAKCGMSSVAIAAEFGVSPSRITEIVQGLSWAHIPCERPGGTCGQSRPGSSNPAAKLDEDIVIRVRRLARTGRYCGSDIAKRLGITQQQVSAILVRRIWADVIDPLGNEPIHLPKGTAGGRNGMSKLTPGDVDRMRQMRSAGMSFAEIGRAAGVSPSAASRACTGKSWRHVG